MIPGAFGILGESWMLVCERAVLVCVMFFFGGAVFFGCVVKSMQYAFFKQKKTIAKVVFCLNEFFWLYIYSSIQENKLFENSPSFACLLQRCRFFFTCIFVFYYGMC